MYNLVNCSMKYQQGSSACEEVDLSPSDVEPERVVPMSWYTVGYEIFDRFL